MIKHNIAKTLEEKRVTMRKLSKLTGMSYSHVYNTVNRDDIEAVKLGTLLKIAEVLEVDVKDLFEDH